MINYDDFLELCETRTSYREFSEKKVSVEEIKKIFKAGQLAPSSCNQQGYKFLVITKREQLDKLAKCTSKKLYKSPQAMFCFTNLALSKANYDTIQSTSASIMSMLYAIHSMGLGGYWVAGFEFNKKTKAFFKKEYDLPSNYILQALVIFGYKKKREIFYEEKCRLALDTNFLIDSSLKEKNNEDEQYLDKIMPVYFDRYYRVYDLRLNKMLREHLKEGTQTLYLNAFYGTFLNSDIQRPLTITNAGEYANIFLKKIHPQYTYINTLPQHFSSKKRFKQIVLVETLNHFPVKETLKTAIKHTEDKGELLIVFKNIFSPKSLLYYTYKFLGKTHYNQPLEYVKNKTSFLRRSELLGTLKKLKKELSFDYTVEYTKHCPSDKYVFSRKLEEVFPSYTFLKIKVSFPEKEKKSINQK